MTKKSEQGFTLVEMLTVLSLIGLISSLMLTMMGQFRGIIAIDRSLTEQANLQKTVNHISELIGAAEALPLDMGPEGVAQFMSATNNSLRMLAVTKHRDANYGLSEYSIFVEENTTQKDLVEALKPRRHGAEKGMVSRIVLLQDIENLSFDFLEPQPSGKDQQNWRQNWSVAAKLPVAVRVLVAKKTKAGKRIQATSIAYLVR